MPFKNKTPSTPVCQESKPPKCDPCSDLKNCDIQDLGNVDTAVVKDGDILCWDTEAGVWTNLSKEDILSSSEIYVSEGVYGDSQITFTYNQTETPFTVDLSGLSDELCLDSEFIEALVNKINTDNQDATQVSWEPSDINSPLGGAITVAEGLDLVSQCLKDIKDGSLFDFSVSGDDITWTVNGVSTTVSISHPVVSLVDNGSSFSLTVDGGVVQTINFPVVSVSENTDGSMENILVNGVIVGTFADNDTISSAHPNYTIGEDNSGNTVLYENGVPVGVAIDNDTISTPHPVLSFTPNAINGTDVLINGILVYTIFDNDTVSSPHPVYAFEENAAGDLEVSLDGVVIATIIDSDTVSTPHPVMTFSPNSTNGTDVLVDGVVVYTIPNTDVVITQSGNTYTFVEGGNIVGTIDTIPDTDTSLTLGTQTVNPDGSITQCFTTTALDGSTPNGLDDVCFVIPATSSTENTSTDNSIVVNGDDLSAKAAYSDGSPIYADIAAFEAAANASSCPIGGTVIIEMDNLSTLNYVPAGPDGTRLNIRVNGPTNYEYLTLSASLRGSARKTTNHSIDVVTNGQTLLYTGESIQLVTDGTVNQIIAFNDRQFTGSANAGQSVWHQEKTGMIDWEFQNNVADLDVAVSFPFPNGINVLQKNRLHVTAMDLESVVAGGVGQPLPLPNDAAHAFVWLRGDTTATDLFFGVRQVNEDASAPDQTVGPARITIEVKNIIPDYSILSLV